jgi:hypothetical protein
MSKRPGLIIDDFTKASAYVGGLFVPAGSLESALKKYCKKLFIHTGVSEFPYEFFGSASALKIGSKHLVFCCGHQIDQYNPENVSILHVATNNTISGGRKIWPTVTDDNKDTDWIDVRALEYPIQQFEIPNLSSDFFSIEKHKNVWPINSELGTKTVFLLYGYPTEHQVVDYEIPRIHNVATCTTALYDGPSNSPYVHRIRMTRKDVFDSDGMSGGPVFYLGSTGVGEYFVGFAGMIVRGSQTSDFIHFVEARFLLTIFDH